MIIICFRTFFIGAWKVKKKRNINLSLEWNLHYITNVSITFKWYATLISKTNEFKYLFLVSLRIQTMPLTFDRAFDYRLCSSLTFCILFMLHTFLNTCTSCSFTFKSKRSDQIWTAKVKKESNSREETPHRHDQT